jgi:hypothetical protein
VLPLEVGGDALDLSAAAGQQRDAVARRRQPAGDALANA